MLVLVRRHLTIYRKNKAALFFSLLGSLISLGLYLLFMKRNLASSFAGLTDFKQLSDLWLLGGSLGTAAITTSLAGAGQLVLDRERQVIKDFQLTDLSVGQIYGSYYLSASVIGLVMQLVLLGVMWGVFHLQDGLTLTSKQLVLLMGCLVLVSLVMALGNLIVVFFLHKTTTLGQLSSLIGTLAGFLSATYMPLGVLPTSAQLLLKATPALYVSSLYRQVLMAEQLKNVPVDIKEFLGIGIELGQHLTRLLDDVKLILGWGLLFLLVGSLLCRYVKRIDKETR